MLERRTRGFGRRLRTACISLGGLAMALTTLATQPACVLKSCDGVGCESRASGTLEVHMSLDDLKGTRLEMCHLVDGSQPRCAVGELVAAWGTPLFSATTLSDDGNSIFVEEAVLIAPDTVQLSLNYLPGSSETFVDGDTFTIRILDPTESVAIAETTGSVAHFDDVGESKCDDNPACRQGSF